MSLSALGDRGIHLRRPRIGWQGAACPECARSKRRPNDDSLGVELFDDGGARWSCQRCKWSGYVPPADRMQQLHRRPTPAPTPRGALEAPQADRNSELAKEIWRQTVRIRDRLALDYLVCRRGITSWDHDRLRWHPACPWGRERVGCIVAPVASYLTGYTVGIWRIRPVMQGKVERHGLGPARGNLSPIWWPEGDELGITEGVEDALAVHALIGLPCWAALSAGGMVQMRGIPAWIRNVTVFSDADEVGQQGAHILAHRLREDSKRVKVVRAIGAKDPNDALLARAG